MKKVLIVDDDESFLHSLIDGFKAYENDFTVATAGDGLEATKILKKQKISLVLTDLKMPRMDGFELVAHLSRNYSEIPVIVMTAFGTPEMEDNLRDMGTFRYIEKPIDFAVLVEKITKGLDGPSKGFITGISLSSFLQLIEIDKKNCTLTIHAGAKKGIMYFRDGNILDANFQNLKGSDAAYTIISWQNVEIEIENRCLLTEENIKETLGFILLEGSRRKDEGNAATVKPDLGSGDTGMGALESLNMEKMDLDLSTESSLPPETVARQNRQKPEQSADTTTNPALSQFVALLNSFPEIKNATISTTDGIILHQDDQSNNNSATFFTYAAVAAEQIEIAIGASDNEYSLFTLTDDSKLLILYAHEIVVGLNIDNTAFPEPIADGLRPVLNRISIPKNN